ncbi:uncharacterized protein LACBIDRAFT_333058 [Laccaria bicolor S238N-H82]|uniref:Predicted protein n=1 Tax=Laccaria bicolor (strain S238N-H82 / ATCC MYA-4686) TaxID=486041 RepID=B0DUQ3_LACBS|nr:uncharacterized protein LACBIDRAFT_333058 [Laccaria bicolor S238N-H82]EDR01654.1 predicted protein [Laccaria bicolor S238N-H82]|eukprot:XP_001887730.1 predicted protein [Laccaria bicolor S238N-H82]
MKWPGTEPEVPWNAKETKPFEPTRSAYVLPYLVLAASGGDGVLWRVLAMCVENEMMLAPSYLHTPKPSLNSAAFRKRLGYIMKTIDHRAELISLSPSFKLTDRRHTCV